VTLYGGRLGMLSSTLTKPSNVGKRVPRAQHQGTASDQRDLGVDSFHVYKADEVIRRAVSTGREVQREPKDGFYGEHSRYVCEPFGDKLRIGHSIEELSFEEKAIHRDDEGQGRDRVIPFRRGRPSFGVAKTLIVRRHFHPISTRAHAAPTPAVILGRVIEKEDTRCILAPLDKTQISVAQEIAG